MRPGLGGPRSDERLTCRARVAARPRRPQRHRGGCWLGRGERGV